MLTKAIEQEITDRIKANYKLKELILFGSYAYGNPDEDSDIDMVVILDEESIAAKYSEIHDRRVKLSRLLLDIERTTPLDILIYTSSEWDQLIQTGSSFIREVTSKGRRIA